MLIPLREPKMVLTFLILPLYSDKKVGWQLDEFPTLNWPVSGSQKWCPHCTQTGAFNTLFLVAARHKIATKHPQPHNEGNKG